jgi:hypothetical protein
MLAFRTDHLEVQKKPSTIVSTSSTLFRADSSVLILLSSSRRGLSELELVLGPLLIGLGAHADNFVWHYAFFNLSLQRFDIAIKYQQVLLGDGPRGFS